MVTSEEVKIAVLAAGLKAIDHHDCSICGVMVRYLVEGDWLYFDSNCACCCSSLPSPCEWDDLSDWINMQSNPFVKGTLMQRMGLSEARIVEEVGDAWVRGVASLQAGGEA